jgi:hypothetical protein
MSLAMVASRWTASMSRWTIDMDGSTVSASHKTARAAPFLRGFTNSPWTGYNEGAYRRRCMTEVRFVERLSVENGDECAFCIHLRPTP